MAIRTVKPHTGVKGMDIVLRNLAREIENIKERSLVGVLEAAALIRRDMDKTPPLIPVDIGNLRASWFVVTAKSQENESSNFKGEMAGKLKSQHNSVMSRMKSIAMSTKQPIVIMNKRMRSQQT